MNSYKNCQPSWFFNPDIGKVFVLQKNGRSKLFATSSNMKQSTQEWTEKICETVFKKSEIHMVC